MERFGDCMDQGYKMIAEFARSAQSWDEDTKIILSICTSQLLFCNSQTRKLNY